MFLKYKERVNKKIKFFIPFAILLIVFSIFIVGKIIQTKNYKSAVTLMERGRYEEAAQAFKTMGNFKNSMRLHIKCTLMPGYEKAIAMMKEGNYKGAKKKFEVLDGFLDSKKKAQYCSNSSAYLNAKNLMKDGSYIEAADAFGKLNHFKDAKKLSIECMNLKEYGDANDLLKAGKYTEARKTFEKIAAFRNSHQLINQCYEKSYSIAKKYMKNGEYTKAKKLLTEIGTYKDSIELGVKCENFELKKQYNKAKSAYKEKKYYTAYKIFDRINNYFDSKEKAKACIRPYPKTKLLYKNKEFSFNFAPIVIHAVINEPTYLKIYTKKGKLVATVFINEGDSINFDMPCGNYIIKEANGIKWYGEKEMFGEEGEYYVLATELKFINWGSGYKITLNNSKDGNLESHSANRKKF